MQFAPLRTRGEVQDEQALADAHVAHWLLHCWHTRLLDSEQSLTINSLAVHVVHAWQWRLEVEEQVPARYSPALQDDRQGEHARLEVEVQGEVSYDPGAQVEQATQVGLEVRLQAPAKYCPD